MAAPLVLRFLKEECNEYVRSLLLTEMGRPSGAAKYLTFNVFNVNLNFEQQLATVEDELDPESEETLPLSDFQALLQQAT